MILIKKFQTVHAISFIPPEEVFLFEENQLIEKSLYFTQSSRYFEKLKVGHTCRTAF